MSKRNYKIIKEREATKKEVFENLKNGGLKLLCENLNNHVISEVDWVPGGSIEVIVIENDHRVANYFMHFPYHDLFQMEANTTFFKNKKWYIGHIED